MRCWDRRSSIQRFPRRGLVPKAFAEPGLPSRLLNKGPGQRLFGLSSRLSAAAAPKHALFRRVFGSCGTLGTESGRHAFTASSFGWRTRLSCCHGTGELPVHLGQPSMAQLAAPGHRFGPAEGFLDPLSDAQADAIAGMARGPAISGKRPSSTAFGASDAGFTRQCVQRADREVSDLCDVN